MSPLLFAVMLSPLAAQPGSAPTRLAPETALLLVELTPAGEIHIGEVSRRPFAFHGKRLPASALTASHAGGASPYLLVVHGPRSATPIVLPLELPEPSAVEGDLVSPWVAGSIVVRAPSFGPGSRFEIGRVEKQGFIPRAHAAVTQW